MSGGLMVSPSVGEWAIKECDRLRAALQWIVDHGDTSEGGRPACHAMRAHARTALEAKPK